MLEEGAMYRRIGIIVTAAAMGMLVAGTPAQAANTPVLAWSQGGTTITSYDFGTVDGVGGQTATQTFTLTNSGRSASAALTVTLSGSSAFSTNVDGCTGTSLGPNTSCAVIVTYAPTVSGEIDNATLTAQGKKAAANASITLTGQGGTPYLTLSPGTFTGTDSNGTNDYGYDFGLVGSSSVTQTFAVTNSGTGTSNTLQLAPCCNTGFTLSNNQTTGSTLAPGGTATFQLTLSPSSLSCTGPGFLTTPLAVGGQSNGSPYISVTYTAFCGEVPPITSVTAGLRNSSPQFVSIGNPGSQQPIAVLGTLKNVSVGPTPPPPPSTLKCPPTCEGLHSFTIQIPFLTNAGTLYCSMGNAYQPGTCSVSNNVLTVTQNFTFPQPFRWLPGHSEQIGYVYVGASQLGEYVTWGTPTVTAAN
jgi:hypothetical protein